MTAILVTALLHFCTIATDSLHAAKRSGAARWQAVSLADYGANLRAIIRRLRARKPGTGTG